MTALRRATALVVAAWLGAALLTAAVVAPAAFAELPTRALAGALVGRILPVLFLSGAVVALAGWWVAGKSERRNGMLRLALVVWFVAMMVAHFVVTPRIESVRASAGAALETLAVSDPARVSFGRLHGVSVLLLGVGMLGALLMLVDEMRTERRSRG